MQVWNGKLLRPKTVPTALGNTYFGRMAGLMVTGNNGFPRPQESSEHLLVNSQSLRMITFWVFIEQDML